MEPIPPKSSSPSQSRDRRMSEARASLVAALEGFCARTNDGLAAMALVLALVLAVSAMARYPDGFPVLRDAETGLGGEDPAVTLDGLQAP